MKKLLFFILVITLGVTCNNNKSEPQSDDAFDRAEAGVASNTYYLSPTGKDGNNGSISSPFKTLNKAWTVVVSGDLIYMRGGTYSYSTSQDLQGKNDIRVWNYPGEIPQITDSSNYSGQDLIFFNGSNVHWKGLEIRDFRRADFGWYAFRSQGSVNCTYEQLNVHHNRSALGIRGASTGNLVLNSDFHHNADPEDGYGGSDGLNISIIPSTSATNTIRGCRSWYNSDDGFDTWQNEGYVLIEDCWSWNNGYVEGTFNPAGDGGGFKMGETNNYTSLKRTLKNCIAAENRNWGFNENHSFAKHELINCIAYKNGKWNYTYGWWPQSTSQTTISNSISYKAGGMNSAQDMFVNTTANNNSWNGKIVTDSKFKSLDISQLLKPRNADGSLPSITYLQATGDLTGLGYVSGTGPVVPPPPPPPPPPVVDTMKYSVILFGNDRKRRAANSYALKAADGYYYYQSNKIWGYADRNNIWFYLTGNTFIKWQ